MNTDYILCCGSTVDLTKEHLDSRNIPYICFSYSLDGKEYIDDLGQTMPLADFYKAMENGADTRTSQINSNEYIDFFTPFLEDGKDIIYVSLSSGLSGTYQAACMAVEELKEKYPDRKMYMIDSLGASSGYGLLVDKLADMRDEGLDAETVAAWGKENAHNLHYWFCSTDLTFFVKGGRVSKAAGWFGTVLKICPILNANFEGKLIPRKKVKGKVKAVEGLADMMMQHATDGADYSDKCFISHSACKQDAQHLADILKERFPKIKGDILINDIGTTIGSHTGPGTVALFFWGDKRVD